jgi:hypothetical protein
VTFTPATAYVGADTFQYTVEDNLGAASNVATVTVTVTAPPRSGGDGGGGALNGLSVLALGMLAAAMRRPAVRTRHRCQTNSRVASDEASRLC